MPRPCEHVRSVSSPWSPEQYSVKCTDHIVPHCAILFTAPDTCSFCWAVGVRFLAKANAFFSSSQRPDRLWGPPRLLRWWMTVMLVLVKDSLVKTEVWDGALWWRNSHFYCRQSSGRNLTFSRTRRKSHSSMQNWLLGLSGKIMSMLLTLLFTRLAFFRSRWVWTFRVRLMLSSRNAYLIIARVSVDSFFEICTMFDAVPLSDPSRHWIRPDTDSK
jgi:hypothetical protein